MTLWIREVVPSSPLFAGRPDVSSVVDCPSSVERGTR